MSQPPACTGLGAQCRSLRTVVRIGTLDDDPHALDHTATWLLGHTEHISFGALQERAGDLLVEAVLHTPCKHLASDGGRARCAAHGFRGPIPRDRPRGDQSRQLGAERFRIVEGRRLRALTMPATGARRGALPVLASANGNPCLGAPCRTGDNRQGAACCRDLELEIMCSRDDDTLETLLRSRKAPYLCKVARDKDVDDAINAEVISACGFLGEDGVACVLHGRQRPEGGSAKPPLCYDWPPKRETIHPGCVFGPKSKQGKPKRRRKQPA